MKDRSKESQGIFKRVLSVLSGKSEKEVRREEDEQLVVKDSDPTDLRFVKNFTAAGGKFIHCTEEQDLVDNLQHIADELGTQTAFCASRACLHLLQNVEHPFNIGPLREAHLFLTDCEALVAHDGGIMISANQKADKKLEELPRQVVVLAGAHQFVEKLNQGLTAIRERNPGNIPSPITTLHGPHQSGPQDSSPSFETLFLLLLDFDH